MTLPHFLISIWAILAAALSTSIAAELPTTLQALIPPAATGVQKYTQLGSRLAIDGNVAVLASPSDDVGGDDAGIVKVFNAKTGALLHVFLNPRPSTDDFFGNDVAISGTRIVVAAREEDATGYGSGAVYVYDLTSPSPSVPILTIENPEPGQSDLFGSSIAVSGSLLVVGTPYDATGAYNIGSVYIFDLAGASPAIPLHTIRNPTLQQWDVFGSTVAISGTRLVIAAYGEGTAIPQPGIVHVYELTSASPTAPILTIPNPVPRAQGIFGKSIAISGNHIAIAVRHDIGTARQAGRAYVFNTTAPVPSVPVLTLDNPAPSTDDHFGNTLAMSGTRLLVGVPGEDYIVTDTGLAYVYDIASLTPQVPVITLQNPIPTSSDSFGGRVSFSGNNALVSATGDDIGGTDTGSAYVFDFGNPNPNSAWVRLNHSSPLQNGESGSAMAISGRRLIVGAYADETNGQRSGRACVYNLDSPDPGVPVVILNNPEPAIFDDFGRSVAISGNLAVVGAYGDDTAVLNTGSAYVYNLDGPTPAIPILTIRNPTPQVADGFGYAVAIEGNRVAISAHQDKTGGNNAGSVYIYNIASATPAIPVLTINNPGPQPTGDAFGQTLAISGRFLVVGAEFDDLAAGDSGSCFVYDLDGATPSVPFATIPNPSPGLRNPTPGQIPVFNYYFGNSVAIHGSMIVVGSKGHAQGGRAYVFDLHNTVPSIPILTLNNPGLAIGDAFGCSVAISGDLVLVGAFGSDFGIEGAGSAYLYNIYGNSPALPVATFRNPTPQNGDQFGFAVAMDGNTLTIGAPFDDTISLDKGFAYAFGFNRPPTLTLLGGNPLTFEAALSYADPGVKATDPDYGSIAPVISRNTVIPNVTGDYEVTWTVTDPSGASASATRTVQVRDTTPPSIIAPGGGFSPNPLVLGSPFPDYGKQAIVGDVVGVSSVAQEPLPGLEVTRTFSGELQITATDLAGNSTVYRLRIPVILGTSSVTVLAAKDATVPGAGVDTRIQADARWSSFGPPVINNVGSVGYNGKWKSPASAAPPNLAIQAGSGIFVDDTLIVKVGDAVPGAGSGDMPADATFKNVEDPVMDDAGHVAFISTIAGTGVVAGNDTVIASTGGNGELRILAREGSPAPHTNGALFHSLTSVSIQSRNAEHSATLFTATLRRGTGSPAVGNANDMGAWVDWGSQPSPVKLVRENDEGYFAGERVKSLLLLKAIGSSPGHGRGLVDGNEALFQLSFTGGARPRQALFIANPGTLTRIATTGDSLGGIMPTATWKSMSLPSSAGQFISVLGTLTSKVAGVTPDDAKGIFHSSDGGSTWSPLIRLGDAAPGTTAGRFYRLLDPVNSRDGAGVAFTGNARGTGISSLNDEGIWWHPAGNPAQLVAREGDQPPGAPIGARWKSFVSFALPGGSAGPIFTATLQKGSGSTPGPGGITSMDDLALYGVDGLGTLHEIIRENQPLLGKTVKTFHALKAVSGTIGSTRTFNSNCQIAILVTYMDGTTGIVRIDLPGTRIIGDN